MQFGHSVSTYIYIVQALARPTIRRTLKMLWPGFEGPWVGLPNHQVKERACWAISLLISVFGRFPLSLGDKVVRYGVLSAGEQVAHYFFRCAG